MKVKFRNLEIQNFYSYGSKQRLDFSEFGSTVILIDGIDKDTEGAKIGTGKSTIFAAITFALYGETVSNLKANEVVNYIKNKDALVILEFDIDGNRFKVERGRKPNILNLYKNVDTLDEEEGGWDNISKADIRDNNALIETIVGMKFDTFLQTTLFSVASEHNKPFLNMTPKSQKQVLENIFSFETANSMTAEVKDKVRDDQVRLAELEASIREVNFSNEQINQQLERLIESSEKFERRRTKQIDELNESIAFYSTIDVEDEKDKFSFLEELKEHKQKISESISELRSDAKDVQSSMDKEDREIEILSEKYEREEKKNESLKGNVCPTCNQDWEDAAAIEASDKKLLDYGKQILAFEKSISEHDKAKKQLKKSISDKKDLLEEIREAMDEVEIQVERKELDNIDVVVTNLKNELKTVKEQDNHYLAEIEANKELLREVDMTEIDKLAENIGIWKSYSKQMDDQKLRGKFLRKFIRQSNEILKGFKKLIPDFNIHLQFNPDFTIRIMKLGKEVSAGTLSNGEKRIGNIMIMLALMKVFKLKNHVEFNALFLDEVLDSGINGTLLESVYYFIKNVAKEEKMRVYMISHREEIKEKSKEMILVTKNRGISTLEVNPHLKSDEESE